MHTYTHKHPNFITSRSYLGTMSSPSSPPCQRERQEGRIKDGWTDTPFIPLTTVNMGEGDIPRHVVISGSKTWEKPHGFIGRVSVGAFFSGRKKHAYRHIAR